MYARFMIFCVQMPDVGSDELLYVDDKHHFFLNITKTWRTHAPKKID